MKDEQILPASDAILTALSHSARTEGLRVIGDVHGDVQAFRHATSTQRFIIQLGDLVDYGPDSAGVLQLMYTLLEERRGAFVLGNHDRKLARILNGRRARLDSELTRTLQQIDAMDGKLTRASIATMLNAAPAWIVIQNNVFVHGAFHPAMMDLPAQGGADRLTPILSRALFGETTSHMQADGYPERTLHWVDQIPAGHTIYCGHDNRSFNGRPFIKEGCRGGKAVFLDLGAGKGGHLAWIDIPASELSKSPLSIDA